MQCNQLHFSRNTQSSNICIRYTLKWKYIGNNYQLNQFYVNLHLSSCFELNFI